ncbi:LAETG motif-containing sortase-dependent surface protein [Streptomyces albiaxialis]|uniref:LAETG motif-containing sortase-dependent surface protein n=1 Tax=Streptomyces albiaxialis TaxID=329523 RepID=A0ABN2VQI3_9ACTN
MKHRRTSAAVALAAAITPLTLLAAATAAHAADGRSPSPSPSTSSSPSEPAPEPTPESCKNGPASKVKLSLKGVPEKIEAGGGWHEFSLGVSNKSDSPLGQVEATVNASNGEGSENGDLFKYAWLEFWDAEKGEWLDLEEEGRNDIRDTGMIFGFTDLDGKDSVTLKFRMRIDAEATPGDSYAYGGARYTDPDENCTDGTITPSSTFEVLAPGAGGDSSDGNGNGGDDRPEGGAAPQGGKEEQASTEHLAKTGSSTEVTGIAVAGGLALLAGAGTVYAVRRRKGGSAAA